MAALPPQSVLKDGSTGRAQVYPVDQARGIQGERQLLNVILLAFTPGTVEERRESLGRFRQDQASRGEDLSGHGRKLIRAFIAHHRLAVPRQPPDRAVIIHVARSEEHTSELQSPYDLVCRLLLEKKNKNN